MFRYEINELETVPPQRELDKRYSMYVRQRLCTTWLNDERSDKSWFDKKVIFEELKEDLTDRLQSRNIKRNSDGKFICSYFFFI